MRSAQLNGEFFDVIIVGAGAAGCVLAGRLSEVSSKRILLIEAGPDAPPGREHADIRDPYHVSSGNARFFHAGLAAEVGADPGDGHSRDSTAYLQPFGVGGGSNVNGMFAERGLPSDYNEWRDLGAAGWGWNDVLPYFNKLEHDRNFGGELHGHGGPIPIRRVKPEDWMPFARAVAHCVRRRGLAVVDDANGDFRDGVSPAPMNSLAEGRVSTSMAYLSETVRMRASLTVLANTHVERLITRAGQVCGVVAKNGNQRRVFSASSVIVAAGAVFSPALLLRSGIGSAEHLRSLGIEVVADVSGVGRNLQNHPAILLGVYLPERGIQSPTQRAWQQNMVRYSSQMNGCSAHDMLLLIFGKLGWHRLGRRIGGLAVVVNKAYSVGRVELASADCAIAPRVRFNLLDDTRDFVRLADGVRFALQVLGDEEVARERYEVFTPNTAIGARLAKRTRWNRFRASVLSILMSIDSIRARVLKGSTLDVDGLINNERAIHDYVRRCSRAIYHACGTCRMGSADDANAVVDASCRVRGIDGLRVIDASIFPTIPAAATHLPVIMVAEKMADAIKAEWSQGLTPSHRHYSRETQVQSEYAG